MNRRRIIFGLILLVVGLLLLGRTTDLYYFSFNEFLRILLPLALIAVGAWLIIRKRRIEESLDAHLRSTATSSTATPSTSFQQPHDGAQETSLSGVAGGTGPIKYSKFLGDLSIDCANMNLQNVEISSGIGDIEIRLHNGRLARGLNRMIVSGFIGDIRIMVPTNMPHYMHSSNFIGDIDVGGQRSGGFSNTIEHQSDNYETAESKLYIAANNFIGDIKLFVV